MSKNIVIISMVLLLAVSLTLSMGNTQAQTTQIRNVQGVNRVNDSVEYAVLSVLDDGTLQFQAGETSVIPQPAELRILYSRLGGRMRPNLPNLLNVIGDDGWRLVTFDNGNWTFIR